MSSKQVPGGRRGPVCSRLKSRPATPEVMKIEPATIVVVQEFSKVGHA